MKEALADFQHAWSWSIWTYFVILCHCNCTAQNSNCNYFVTTCRSPFPTELGDHLDIFASSYSVLSLAKFCWASSSFPGEAKSGCCTSMSPRCSNSAGQAVSKHSLPSKNLCSGLQACWIYNISHVHTCHWGSWSVMAVRTLETTEWVRFCSVAATVISFCAYKSYNVSPK